MSDRADGGGRVVLHLVRHGETAWNNARRIQGQLHDVPLSEQGREQARAVAEELARFGAGAIVSSDLRRTMETAAIIGERLGLAVVAEPSLRERHFGIAQGRLYADVADLVREWWRDPEHRVEGGESNREVYERVGAYLERLTTRAPAREIIVVTHGGAMNMALAWLAGTRLEEWGWERLANCDVRTVVVER